MNIKLLINLNMINYSSNIVNYSKLVKGDKHVLRHDILDIF